MQSEQQQVFKDIDELLDVAVQQAKTPDAMRLAKNMTDVRNGKKTVTDIYNEYNPIQHADLLRQQKKRKAVQDETSDKQNRQIEELNRVRNILNSLKNFQAFEKAISFGFVQSDTIMLRLTTASGYGAQLSRKSMRMVKKAVKVVAEKSGAHFCTAYNTTAPNSMGFILTTKKVNLITKLYYGVKNLFHMAHECIEAITNGWNELSAEKGSPYDEEFKEIYAGASDKIFRLSIFAIPFMIMMFTFIIHPLIRLTCQPIHDMPPYEELCIWMVSLLFACFLMWVVYFGATDSNLSCTYWHEYKGKPTLVWY